MPPCFAPARQPYPQKPVRTQPCALMRAGKADQPSVRAPSRIMRLLGECASGGDEAGVGLILDAVEEGREMRRAHPLDAVVVGPLVEHPLRGAEHRPSS